MAGASHGSRSLLIDVKAAKILMLAAVFALVAIGVVMVYSATSATLASSGDNPLDDMQKQLTFVGIGVVAMLVLWFAIPYREWLGVILMGYYIICMVLLVLTILIGTDVNGAKRWLFGFQPSEFIKIALLMMTVRIVYDKNMGKLRLRSAMAQLAGFVGVPLVFLLLTQSDLGTAAICAVGIMAALYLARDWCSSIRGTTEKEVWETALTSSMPTMPLPREGSSAWALAHRTRSTSTSLRLTATSFSPSSAKRWGLSVLC